MECGNVMAQRMGRLDLALSPFDTAQGNKNNIQRNSLFGRLDLALSPFHRAQGDKNRIH